MKRLCLLGVLVCAGCADGTLPELNSANPFLRQQWAQDRQFGPTFHEQVAELRELQANAAELSPADQQFRVRQLTELIRESESTIMRVECVRALAAIPLPQAQEGINMASADEETDVRVAACKAYQKRGGPQSLASLTNMLQNDADIDVRITAARSLGSFKEQAAVNALAKALDDRDPALQLRVMESLGGATGRDYGTDIVAWRSFLNGGNPTVTPPTLAERLRNGLF